MKIWSCKIGESAATPNQADGPMREAVAEAYERMTGEAPTFIFSGWGAALTEPERAVVENRLPEPQTAEQADECGDVVVTWDEDRTRILAVTRQDEDGRVLKIIALVPPGPPADQTNKDLPPLPKPVKVLYIEGEECPIFGRGQMHAYARAALSASAPTTAPIEALSSECNECGGTGLRDLGGFYPWGEPTMIECDCISKMPTPNAPTAEDAKAAYVRAFGSDDGWLGEPGSWFIEGYRAGGAPAAGSVPSDEEIEALALSSGLNKSDEHWGSRYYTELGSSLFRFARALLSRYGQAPAWRPIETAPKDGWEMFVVKAFNVTNENCHVRNYTSDPYCVWPGTNGGWVRWPHPFPPTHWMALPEDPQKDVW